MTSKLFQNLIYQIKSIISQEFGILDEYGQIIACSDDSKVGKEIPIPQKLNETDDVCISGNYAYKRIYIKKKPEYIAFIEYTDETSLKFLSLISINVINMKLYYDEKFDKSSFLKNVLMGNALPGEIAVKAKELHIAYNAYRVVFLIKTEKNKEMYVHETIQGLFPNKSKDFIIVLDDEFTVLIKELKPDSDLKEIEKVARSIVDTLNTETMVKAMVGIGTVADSLAGTMQSFKEAKTALTVGDIFSNDSSIFHYNNLGLGRLIYQLPENLCRLFLKEVFKEGSFESLDAEYLTTIQKFFDNNLNVSETARQMFVHRNTLVYRLDKIKKITGLDLTRFDDAIILKFAMLIKKYLDRGAKEKGLNKLED
ncbi:CdaR family transcriptional regulator [Clostridium thermosuccinogenes]|uniref:CdaR family transcriptional regulator n=1 Tax=Clostridium thermosuccinogenes TaxID=84032 RepID=A0A2K2EV20_9CLOT|nr:helix-turn-helix domain-containing protein [Pseudoclostridium thermosuccinogenes]AUS95514.1 CdaR family transcriptional regulator [Pseudoclostridium thermosuccinogenes]PNT90377.1 CdaR family transcriptional regulator [Pseudoclostridium thermosuccinogenes]PNT96532.1 CdaR family transcriptional regulator [Pseudoclostridium thermosuccinogenes]PNT98275.1 CdaR family transcriptional regulator [Pseudoclostridium thermosuccinogenes]